MSYPITTVVVKMTETTGGAVTTPGAGLQSLYLSLADNLLYRKNSSGTSVAVGSGAALSANNTFTKAQVVASVSLGALVTGTIATDASLGNVFIVSLAGTCTLGNPTNLISGQTIVWQVSQDTAGSRTLAYGNNFTWPGGTPPTLSTAASAVDVITAVYTGSKLRAVINKAFG